MSMMDEFKEFAMRGNMVDLAVGIVVGGAFGGVVKSLVDDVLMPPLGLLIGGVLPAQQLDRDPPPEHVVLRAPDRCHASVRDVRDELVPLGQLHVCEPACPRR